MNGEFPTNGLVYRNSIDEASTSESTHHLPFILVMPSQDLHISFLTFHSFVSKPYCHDFKFDIYDIEIREIIPPSSTSR